MSIASGTNALHARSAAALQRPITAYGVIPTAHAVTRAFHRPDAPAQSPAPAPVPACSLVSPPAFDDARGEPRVAAAGAAAATRALPALRGAAVNPAAAHVATWSRKCGRGFAMGRASTTTPVAVAIVWPWYRIRYAMANAGDRLIPALQCTSTTPPRVTWPRAQAVAPLSSLLISVFALSCAPTW